MTYPMRKVRTNHERWLVSYADFITLLFALFVMMYAFARADKARHVEVSNAIHGGFKSLGIHSPLNVDERIQPGMGSDQAAQSLVQTETQVQMSTPVQTRAELAVIQRELEQSLAVPIKENHVSLSLEREGLVIRLHEGGFFDSGSAVPHEASLPTLIQIGRLLGRTSYQLRIEGHTDNVPVHTAEFESNWELSTARAAKIARIFVLGQLISPKRVSAAGYADYHPIASNSKPEGRAANRRIDLVVLPRFVTSLGGEPASLPAGQWETILSR